MTSDLSATFGIYAIQNTITGAIYVGGTAKSFRERWRAHRSQLVRGEHPSIKLQSDWSEYGEEAFVFSVVEAVSDQRLVGEREEHWIQVLSPQYNTNAWHAGRPLKDTIRVELRLDGDDLITEMLFAEAQARGVTIQQHITDIITSRTPPSWAYNRAGSFRGDT